MFFLLFLYRGKTLSKHIALCKLWPSCRQTIVLYLFWTHHWEITYFIISMLIILHSRLYVSQYWLWDTAWKNKTVKSVDLLFSFSSNLLFWINWIKNNFWSFTISFILFGIVLSLVSLHIYTRNLVNPTKSKIEKPKKLRTW